MPEYPNQDSRPVLISRNGSIKAFILVILLLQLPSSQNVVSGSKLPYEPSKLLSASSTTSSGSGSILLPSSWPPPPNMATRPNYNYPPPNGPPPQVYQNDFRQGQYNAPPPPPQNCSNVSSANGTAIYVPILSMYRKTKGILNVSYILTVLGAFNWNQLFWHFE